MKRMVIIGGGAAGMSALHTLRSLDKTSSITMVSESAPYSPLPYSEFIVGNLEEARLRRYDPSHFRNLNVKFMKGKISSMNPRASELLMRNGIRIRYDCLLLAQGAVPIKPPILGIEKKGVFFVSNIEEAKRIRKWISELKGRRQRISAVIVGAGFAGLECAASLKKAGAEVHVVEMLDRVLPRMLDKDVAAEVEKTLRYNGVKVHLRHEVSEIVGEDAVIAVKTKKGKMPASLVLIAVGTRPNLEFLGRSGIKVDKGILVDENMRTSKRNIYAAGDAVEFADAFAGLRRINAIWPNAVDQGKVAAFNMLGKERRFEGSDIFNSVEFFDVPVVAMGYMSGEAWGDGVVLKTRDCLRKFIFQKNRLIGYQAVGRGALGYAGLIHHAMKCGVALSKDDIKEGRLKKLFLRFLRPCEVPGTS